MTHSIVIAISITILYLAFGFMYLRHTKQGKRFGSVSLMISHNHPSFGLVFFILGYIFWIVLALYDSYLEAVDWVKGKFNSTKLKRYNKNKLFRELNEAWSKSETDGLTLITSICNTANAPSWFQSPKTFNTSKLKRDLNDSLLPLLEIHGNSKLFCVAVLRNTYSFRTDLPNWTTFYNKVEKKISAENPEEAKKLLRGLLDVHTTKIY